MKRAGICLLAVAAAAGLAKEQPAAGKAVSQPRTQVTCNWPVGPNDSARTLLRRFGRQARMADIGVGEGETERGVELFFNDPRRRMTVLFWDPARRHPEKVQFWNERAPWTVAGIRMGDSIESIQRRNGRPFTLNQFGADYSGFMGDFKGGTFATIMGVCEPWIVFDEGDREVPPEGGNPLIGDGELSSDHPAMPKAKAFVGTLGVRFDPPPDMFPKD